MLSANTQTSLFPKWHVEKTDRESTLNHEQYIETSVHDFMHNQEHAAAININVADACSFRKILLCSAAWCS